MRKTRVVGWLLAVGFSGFGAVNGCGGSTTPVGSLNAPVEGESCLPSGSSAKASDGCNTCFCGTDGHWFCSKKDCGGSTQCKEGEQKGADDGCNSCTCSGGSWACTDKACPTTCQPGETKSVDCNTCGCTSDRKWVCTLKACATPACKEGDTKLAPDGCNTCTCSAGGWACTLKGCPTPVCKEGESMPAPDGCNSCTCSGGGWACTERACPVPECKLGETKQVSCNTCNCSEQGTWLCTRLACQSLCPAAAPSPGACDAVVVWAKDPKSGTCCQYGTPCTAPSGWATFPVQADCEKASLCPAPVDSGNVCPAVVVYAKDPVTGLCCEYGDPCRAPASWKQFNTREECTK